MAENSKIEWTDHSFSPWIGCTRVSPACDNCYAADMSKRYGWAKWGPGEVRRFAATSTWKQTLTWNRKAQREAAQLRAALREFLVWFGRQNDGLEGVRYLNGDSDKYPGTGHDDIKKIGAIARAALPEEPRT